MEDSDMPISGGCDIRIDLAHLPNELFSGITFIADNTPHHNISLGEYDDFHDVEFHWLLRYHFPSLSSLHAFRAFFLPWHSVLPLPA